MTLQECYIALGGEYHEVVSRLRREAFVKSLCANSPRTTAMRCCVPFCRTIMRRRPSGPLIPSKEFVKTLGLRCCMNRAPL